MAFPLLNSRGVSDHDVLTLDSHASAETDRRPRVPRVTGTLLGRNEKMREIGGRYKASF